MAQVYQQQAAEMNHEPTAGGNNNEPTPTATNGGAAKEPSADTDSEQQSEAGDDVPCELMFRWFCWWKGRELWRIDVG